MRSRGPRAGWSAHRGPAFYGCGIAVLLLLASVCPGGLTAQVTPPDAPPVAADTIRTPAAIPAPADPNAPVPAAPAGPAPTGPVADTIPGAGQGDLAGDTIRPPVQLDPAADSMFQYLRALPGYVATEYQGERASYRAREGILRLEGNAMVVRSPEQLTADTIIYLQREGLVEAYGSPRVQGQAQALDANRLFYELGTQRARALGARTEVTESATWFVSGDIVAEGSSTLLIESGHFTSCDLAIPHYHFQTGEILVHRGRILVARSAKLYFGNVPVFWLPFFVQNLEEGRRSGLLTPRFGLNDIVRASSGYTRQISDVGFYWAINEYMGAQLSTTWRSGSYTAAFGTFDFNWRRQFLTGSVTAQRYWQTTGQRSLNLNGNASWRPDERTSLSINGGYASSSQFVRQSTVDPREATQNLNSSLNLSRQFGWGQARLGATRSQSISSGDVTMTLPSFDLSVRAITRGPVTLNIGNISGTLSQADYDPVQGMRRQDQEKAEFRFAPSLSIGDLTIGTSASLTQTELRELDGTNPNGEAFRLPGHRQDVGTFSLSTGYRIPLIGTTSITPAVSVSREVRRDTLSGNAYVSGPARTSVGASMNTDLYGFFPGFGNFSAIRHRISPNLSWAYAPEVNQSPLQTAVFGQSGGNAQNRITIGFNQTFEAKLRTPREAEAPITPADSIAADSLGLPPPPPMPSDPQKMTLLSITTSAFEYDFVRAREEGSGFTTQSVSNTINSDFLRGLSIQMRHDLFDRSALDPSRPENVGRLGRFSPRLSSLNTAFELGPQSAVVRWLERFAFGRREGDRDPGVIAAPPDSTPSMPTPQSSFTGNPQGTGGGPWRLSLAYAYTRPSRTFSPSSLDDSASQTVTSNMSFQLSENWSVNWATDYSLSDGEFGTQRLGFQRNLHEWQAHFNFYQTPTGNSAFEFYVQLLHNTDLKFDYQESNLGIDRPR